MRGRCVDGERMDIGLQHVADGRVNQAMTGDRGHAAKGLGHDAHAIMTLPAGGAGVARVEAAFVFDHEFERSEAGFEPVPQPLLASRESRLRRRLGRHVPPSAGAAAVFPCSQMTCGIMKISIATVMPNTLKLTQTPSGKFHAMEILDAA